MADNTPKPGTKGAPVTAYPEDVPVDIRHDEQAIAVHYGYGWCYDMAREVFPYAAIQIRKFAFSNSVAMLIMDKPKEKYGETPYSQIRFEADDITVPINEWPDREVQLREWLEDTKRRHKTEWHKIRRRARGPRSRHETR